MMPRPMYLSNEEIGNIFAEHAAKVASLPVRDCKPRPADVNAIFDQYTQNWNNTQDWNKPVCYSLNPFPRSIVTKADFIIIQQFVESRQGAHSKCTTCANLHSERDSGETRWGWGEPSLPSLP